MSRPRIVEIPEPSLIVLVGAAGAGKSTFASRHFAPHEVLSSDAFREQLTGDAADQSATRAAFAALHRAVTRRLAQRLVTVVDATNVLPGARRPLVRRAIAAGVPAVAVVLDLPPAVVIERNATRPGRRVPVEVVERQLADLARIRLDGGLEREGFALVTRLGDPADVDAVRIVRSGA